ncbi:MAG: DUF4445 domain-containing protein [Desulfobacteraceae bacterium]|nr:MAG: DUF4445 domain-containing protein [Desulfobacteraceae bacterium]
MDIDEKVKIIFQPSGRRWEVKKGISIIEASRQLGVDIESLCGEKKVCGKCRVRVEEGLFEKYGISSSGDHASPWQEQEGKFITPSERKEGFRLGCCARVNGEMLIFVPEESRAGKQVVSKAARDIPIRWDPAVKCYHVEAEKPTFQDPKGDLERVLERLNSEHGLKNLDIDYLALRTLPDCLRQGGWSVTLAVWMDREIIRVMPGRVEEWYGMAIDIGTTTVAAYLCNLATMKVLDTASMMNPQCKYGEDVMSRITYSATHKDGLERMSDDLLEGLNSLVAQACESTHPPENKAAPKGPDGSFAPSSSYACLRPEDLLDVTIVGNTAMHHILLKLNPEHVGMAPFPPVVHKGLDIKARDLGIGVNESAYVCILPNEAGFVGADNVGVLIAEEPYKSERVQLIIDIGTNGELVLGNRDKLISSSCATGPALEGAQLAFGMRAAPGAIERIRIDPETHEVDYKVVGRETWRSYSKPAEMGTKGICGSGILDVLAELYRSGVVLKSGRFNPSQKTNRFRRNPANNQPEFVIAWAEETSIGKDIVITQKDVRQIQLAKGALYCGCKLMMRRMGVRSVDVVKIAGAFGTHVDREKALIMGLFPDCPMENILAVGNAAGDGARAALLNRKKREEAEWVAANVEYIELTVEEDFEKEFMQAMQIPHMKDEFPHLKGVVPDRILHQR